MTHVQLVLLGAVTLAVVGMLLVIGGVLVAGLFLPGVIATALSLLAFGGAGVLAVIRSGRT